jgi:hypothetical protein
MLSPGTSVRAAGSSGKAKLATDGTPCTLWTSAGTSRPWLQFDFGDPYTICRYVIRHAGDSGLSREHNTREYTVQASRDGASWKTIDRFQGNTANVTDVDLDPVTARYVKIIVEDAGVDSTARIADVEIFGRTGG